MLKYNWQKIRNIARDVKKKYKVASLIEIVQYVYTDEEVLALFIKEGADLKDINAAHDFIGEKMTEGVDFEDLQVEVIEGLIDANFYKKELTAMIEEIKSATIQKSEN